MNILTLLQASLERAIQAGIITREEIEAAFPEEGNVDTLCEAIVEKLNGEGEPVSLPIRYCRDYNPDWMWRNELMQRYERGGYDPYLFAEENPDHIRRTKECRRECVHRLCLGRRMTVEQVKHLFEERGFHFSLALELVAKGPSHDGKRTYTLAGIRTVEGKPETYLCLCVWRSDDSNFAQYEEIGPEGFPADALFQGFFWDPFAYSCT